MIRIIDIFLSISALIVLFPFMLPIMIGLVLTGEHCVFYAQPRIGKHGKTFSVLKFATMLKDSPNLPGGFITQSNDPRILPLGRFLRKTKINELPQLINVLLGQMSFVGPRPVVASHVELYSREAREVMLAQLPGISGIASLVFRDEESILNKMPGNRKENHDKRIAPFKGQLELWYGRHRSVRLYFKIIFLTATAVLFPGKVKAFDLFRDLPAVPADLKPYL